MQLEWKISLLTAEKDAGTLIDKTDLWNVTEEFLKQKDLRRRKMPNIENLWN